MIIQQRDIEILSFVFRYKYACTNHIYHNFFMGKSRVAMHKVLKRIKGMELIKLVHFPRIKNLNIGNLIYLTEKGAKCLSEEWGTSMNDIGFKKIVYPIQSINHYYHRMKIIDFMISLDKDLTEFPNLILKKIVTESEREKRDGKQVIRTHIESTDGSCVIVPDIYFILKNSTTSKERFFFVEIDCGKETIGGGGKFRMVRANSLLEKYQRYELILKDGNWKNILESNAPVFQILTVTETEKHIRTIKRQCNDFINYPNLFLYTTHEQIEHLGVLKSEIWMGLDEQNCKRQLLK
ncbi:replication-relaxation family protein [Bacteroidales bacterium AH-315-N07]|nr:replication-relaxation family protein [Bacteroidales bacterium AH-315-N07]